MKLLHFLFLIIVATIMSPELLAQTDKYIELTVTDTINLKPVGFSYEISSGSKPFLFAKKDEDNVQNAISLNEIEQLLLRNKFAFEIGCVINCMMLLQTCHSERSEEWDSSINQMPRSSA